MQKCYHFLAHQIRPNYFQDLLNEVLHEVLSRGASEIPKNQTFDRILIREGAGGHILQVIFKIYVIQNSAEMRKLYPFDQYGFWIVLLIP